jgi:hypothetical protein
MITLRSKSLQNPSMTSDPVFRFKPSDTKLEQVAIEAQIKETEEAEARARSKDIGD